MALNAFEYKHYKHYNHYICPVCDRKSLVFPNSYYVTGKAYCCSCKEFVSVQKIEGLTESADQKTQSEQGGTKFDTDPLKKPPITLVPLRAMWQVAQVMGFGAQKYDRFNWKKGISYSRLADAAMRHIIEFMEGEDLDPESGRPHVAHALCCLSMLLETTMDHPELDDRYKGNKFLPWQEDE